MKIGASNDGVTILFFIYSTFASTHSFHSANSVQHSSGGLYYSTEYEMLFRVGPLRLAISKYVKATNMGSAGGARRHDTEQTEQYSVIRYRPAALKKKVRKR